MVPGWLDAVPPRAPYIVVQNGEYWLRNNGDHAMLAVTLDRLRDRWPGSRIGVLTNSPALLRHYGPGTEPVSDSRLPSPLSVEAIGGLVDRLGTAVVGPAAVGWLNGRQRVDEFAEGVRDRAFRHRRPVAEAHPDVAHPGAEPPSVVPLQLHRNAARAVDHASLVLALGGGYMTDVDRHQTLRTFAVLSRAIDRKIPTAMLGQGLGPMTDPDLLAHAQRVLPGVGLIGLRERLKGPKLLAGLGVSDERVTVTGDDAIELGYSVRQSVIGSDLGVCLRVADYSPVAARARIAVGRAVRTMADQTNAALVPLIISEYRSEDRRSTMPLVSGYPRVIPPLGRFVRAADVARRVSRCRVLLTGAYHLAVFALSQGIPVVGMTSSEYYDDKLLGLGDMFGGGLQLVHLEEPDLEEVLGSAIRSMWQQAPGLRDGLRSRAAEQIRSGVEFYTKVFGLVDAAGTGRS